MPAGGRSKQNLPNTRSLTIIAQDPSIRLGRRLLTAQVQVPAEDLAPGPCGHRVHIIDYDVNSNSLYKPATYRPADKGQYPDPYAAPGKAGDSALLADPRFHAQNVYAIVMRTLARFEFALGRRVAWGSAGHQLHIVPHAFADANAFYSREDRAIFFGYFAGASGRPIFTCLAHDIVAHETTHALLDGLRSRYLEPSSPDQAGFHEGFADVVALLSVFSLPDIVAVLLDRARGGPGKLIDERFLTAEALKCSVLFGLAEEMGEELSRVRGEALRRSVTLKPGKRYMSLEEYEEPHQRGELLVAAMMNAFLDIWLSRLDKVGRIRGRLKDRSLVVEEGARVAEHLLTMAIRAIDYAPPTDINFPDYLSALLTVDREVVPDDTKYDYRGALVKRFADYDIMPAEGATDEGTWQRFEGDLVYNRTHFESMLRDKEEVFRFIWENRKALQLHKDGYIEVLSVRACTRIGPDGFVLRETVAEYLQILTLRAGELKQTLGLKPPPGLPEWKRVRILGGGALIFDEYGRLKYQIRNRLESRKRQQARLDYLARSGFFDEVADPRMQFARMHMTRAAG
jgi:hypothetical protein